LKLGFKGREKSRRNCAKFFERETLLEKNDTQIDEVWIELQRGKKSCACVHLRECGQAREREGGTHQIIAKSTRKK